MRLAKQKKISATSSLKLCTFAFIHSYQTLSTHCTFFSITSPVYARHLIRLTWIQTACLVHMRKPNKFVCARFHYQQQLLSPQWYGERYIVRTRQVAAMTTARACGQNKIQFLLDTYSAHVAVVHSSKWSNELEGDLRLVPSKRKRNLKCGLIHFP